MSFHLVNAEGDTLATFDTAENALAAMGRERGQEDLAVIEFDQDGNPGKTWISEAPSPGTDLVIPTGELVLLNNPPQVAQALESLRALEQQIRQAKEELTYALVQHSKEIGNRTIQLPGGRQAIVKGGSEIAYDAEAIMEGLREAGMSEQRISEIVSETVSYKVKAVEAKRAAAANEDYAAVIEQNSQVVPSRVSVEIK